MSATGDKVGYVVLIQDRFNPAAWIETPSGIFTTASDAVSMVDVYEDRHAAEGRRDTYAVARLELVMISRPTPAARDLLGIAPDFTGGLSTDEYMDEQRGRVSE